MKQLLTISAVLSLTPLAAFAEAATGQPSPWQLPIMLVIFMVIFYLMVWRPQSKRTKEHRQLMSSISKGDEVLTSAGLAGKVVKVLDDYIQIEVDNAVTLTFQKQAISAVLPKGTLKAL